MAKCKLCKTNIPDGIEYCDDCLDKKKTNETYLDSLLNSVKNTAPSVENIYKKKMNAASNSQSPIIMEEPKTKIEDYDMYKIDLNDIEDFNQFDFSEDLDNLNNDIFIGDEDLFGESLGDYFGDEYKKSGNSIEIDTMRNKDNVIGSKIERKIINNFDGKLDIKADNNVDRNTESNTDRNTDRNTDINVDSNLMSSINKNVDSDADNNIISNIDNNIISNIDNNVNSNIDNNVNKNFDNIVDSNIINELDKYKSINLSNNISDDINNNEDRLDLDKEIADLLNTMENEDPLDDIRSERTVAPAFDNITQNEESPSSSISQNNINQNEILDYNVDEGMDPDINDLLNSLEVSTENEEYERKEPSQSNIEQISNEDSNKPTNMDDYEQLDTNDDDFLSLLNQISSDDPVAADVKAINDLLNGEPVKSQNKSTSPSDVGEVFSNALKVVTSLNDYDEDNILSEIPNGKGKKGKANKKEKKKKNKSKKNAKDDQDIKSEAKKPKMGLLKRLFANIEEEDTGEKPKKKADANEISTSTQKTSKKKSGKNGKTVASKGDANEDSVENQNSGINKKENKKSKKKEDKEKKKKNKEIIQVIDEIEEDEGRINRLGAAIVFLFFGLLVMLLLVGTNVVSYSLSIQNATQYFDKQKYTQAYNEVYGIEIKDEDIEIYDKIMTVMFVNKQLNSYNNYYSIGQYPEALDSLLKGLKRYDKYIELATILEIKTDLDYVRNQILAELNNVFHLSEKEALKILDKNNMENYSLEVYDVVIKKMSN
jgi:hypothetical protein